MDCVEEARIDGEAGGGYRQRMGKRFALLSVSDKAGLEAFARALEELGYELLSTGGTARCLREAGVRVRDVADYTGSPEVMGGRVKTLHPRVHGGILAREGVDEADLERLGAGWIDMVVVNLYPFERTVQREDVSRSEAIENIDIGGPSMVRSAAKNHERVTVVCDPSDYDTIVRELRAGGRVSDGTRRRLAGQAFAHTAAYDGAIAAYLTREGEGGERERFPGSLMLSFERAYALRYGENPHQAGAFYRDRTQEAGSVAEAQSLGAGGKELSFNNLVDVDAAVEAVREFDEPAAVVVKHTNPCGVACGATLAEAYRAAREADATSAFGGIVALNRRVSADAAQALCETFLEVVAAPGFDDEALEVLRKKKNLRLLALGEGAERGGGAWVFRRVSGGMVVQERDLMATGEVTEGRVVTRRAPTPQEQASLGFAWRVVKHVKSNAIVLARGKRTVGVGAGQMSRVESVRIACAKAGEGSEGAVLASDAFFPFPDGLELALTRGVVAVVQPGGSVKDEAVIEAADRAGIAMVFTGRRHFRH